jgi:hypothetical protein
MWNRAFNSFGFIALLVCIAVLLTTISSSNADDGRDPAVDLLLLRSQGALIVENRVIQSGSVSHLRYHD